MADIAIRRIILPRVNRARGVCKTPIALVKQLKCFPFVSSLMFNCSGAFAFEYSLLVNIFVKLCKIFLPLCHVA
jgi:hypothetical protein